MVSAENVNLFVKSVRLTKQPLIIEVLKCVFLNHAFYRVIVTNGTIYCLFVSGKGAQNRSRLRHTRKKSVSQNSLVCWVTDWRESSCRNCRSVSWWSLPCSEDPASWSLSSVSLRCILIGGAGWFIGCNDSYRLGLGSNLGRVIDVYFHTVQASCGAAHSLIQCVPGSINTVIMRSELEDGSRFLLASRLTYRPDVCSPLCAFMTCAWTALHF